MRGGLDALRNEAAAPPELVHERGSINQRNHSVNVRVVLQLESVFKFPLKSGGNRHRLGDAGRLNDDLVILARLREAGNGLYEILTQGATDAAVGQLHETVFAAFEVALPCNERRVDVYLGEVVDDDG